MNGSIRYSWFFSMLLQLLGFCLAFVGMPMLLIWYEGTQYLQAERQQDLRTVGQSLNERLNAYNRFSHLDWYLTERLTTCWEKAGENESGVAGAREMAKQIKNEFPGIFEFLFIAPDGRIMREVSDISMPDEVGTQLLADYREYLKDNLAPLRSRISRYRTFLGPLIGIDLTRRFGGKFDEASLGARRSRVFWGMPGKHGIFLAFFTRVPDYVSIVTRRIIQRNNSENGHYRSALVNLERSLDEQDLYGLPASELTRVFVQLGNQSRKHVSAFGRVWAQQLITPNLRYVVSTDDSGKILFQARRKQWFHLCLGAFACLAFLSALRLSLFQRRAFSIPQKFFFLFGYIVGIPILLLGVTSLGLVREHRQLLIRQLQDRQDRFLRDLDRGLVNYLGLQEKTIRRRLTIQGKAGDELVEEAVKRMKKVSRSFTLILGEVYDGKGKNYFRVPFRWQATGEKVYKIFEEQAKRLLARVNNLPIDLVNETRSQLLEASAEMLGIKFSSINAIFLESLTGLMEFPSKERFFLVSVPLWDKTASHAAFLAMAGWSAQSAIEAYATKVIPDRNLFSPDSWVYAYRGDDRFRYRPWPFRATAEKIALEAYDQPFSLRYSFRRRGKNFFITALDGVNLRGWLLVTVNGDSEINREISWMLWRKWVLSCVLLSFGLLVGKLFTQDFLGPVRNLGFGLIALEERRLEVRLPVAFRDELGDAIDSFNRMMEGLQDLEVASALQENFFPRGTVTVGKWAIHGTCLPASRVGGDYFDFFPLDEKRLFIIIGDVGGLGIAAALVVSMVKALIAHPGNRFDPPGLLQLLQRVFHIALKKQKMMTCLVGIFDAETRAFSMANAGHAFPWLIRGDKAEFLEARGIPLGTGSLARPFSYRPEAFQLGSGDSLLFYTLGFIGATAVDGTPLGFDRVGMAVPALMADSPEASEKKMRAWHAAAIRPGPREDDSTLVILQREAEVRGDEKT